MNKRGIGPVIASALLLVVAVVAVVGFQTWFSNYSSITLGNVESKSSNSVGSTSIETIVDSTLYFKNGESTNLSITSVKIGGYDCNVTTNITPGMNSLDLSACIYNLSKGSNEVVIYTNKGVYNEKLYLANLPSITTYLSCSLGGITVIHGENYSFYDTSILPTNNLDSCSSQIRTCNNGTFDGSSSYDTSNIVNINDCSAPTQGGEFVLVNGNSALGTSDFYMMKFSAKNVGSLPTSQAALTPWTSITQSGANTECNTLNGIDSGDYHLITNAEWTTAAREIESQTSNWNSSVIGSGFIYSGHNDNDPPSALVGDNDDDNGYSGTNNIAPSNQRRTHFLSSNEVVWDMAGNLPEWNNDTCTQGDPWYSGSEEWTGTNINGQEKTLAGPYGNYTSVNGVGTYRGCSLAGNVFMKGGAYNDFNNAAIYRLELNNDPAYSVSWIGYRCAYTPSIVESIPMTFSSNVTSILTGGSINLTWSSSGATSCVASGNWNGSKLVSGSEIINSITSNSNYYLNCSNGIDSNIKSLSINLFNDQYWSNVVLLMNGNSALDETGKTVTANGAATIASVASRTGLRVGQATGFTDYYSIPASTDFVFPGDFTIEFWIYGIYRAGNYPTPLSLRTSTATTGHWALHLNPHSEAYIDASIYASGYGFLTPSQPAIFIDSSWHHLAITREGTTVRMFRDGILVGSSTAAYILGNDVAPLTIGADFASVAADSYIDDLRLTKGVARYTSAFTPPTNNLPVG